MVSQERIELSLQLCILYYIVFKNTSTEMLFNSQKNAALSNKYLHV